MNVLENTGTYYEGKIINMFDFKKNKNADKSEKDEADILLLKAEVDRLSSKIDATNQKIEDIFKEIDKKISVAFNKKFKSNNKKNNKLLNFYNTHPLGTSVFASIIATLILNSVNIFNNYITLPSKLNSIETKLDTQISNYNQFKSKIDTDINKLKVDVGTIANVEGTYLYSDLEYTDDFIEELSENTETVQISYYASAPPCKDNDVIAIDNKNSITYTKKQLVGEKLLIPYTYNGQEVLFYGQYNENNNWDQDCTINVYENDKLVLISETEYKNGVPLSSKQVYPETVKSGENVWTITDRKYESNRNYGENWNYFKFNEQLKTFDFESATINNIMHVSDFEKNLKNYSLLEGYYCGEIQNSTYNDKNEKPSYMMKNDQNGYVRTIYIGGFENGDFNDHSGNAQEIVFDESVNKYFYYIGSFTNGERENNDALEYITQDEIDKIIEPYNFNCELNFYNTEEND